MSCGRLTRQAMQGTAWMMLVPWTLGPTLAVATVPEEMEMEMDEAMAMPEAHPMQRWRIAP